MRGVWVSQVKPGRAPARRNAQGDSRLTWRGQLFQTPRLEGFTISRRAGYFDHQPAPVAGDARRVGPCRQGQRAGQLFDARRVLAQAQGNRVAIDLRPLPE